MSKSRNRRDFIKCAVIGAGLCCPLISTCSKKKETVMEELDMDYSTFAYCGLECQNCELYKATLTNNIEVKKRLAKEWLNIEDKDFKAEEIFCYTCKEESKPYNQFLQVCQVRACAKEKQLLTCAHCDDLPTCDKELWTKYPEMKKKIDAMREELLKV